MHARPKPMPTRDLLLIPLLWSLAGSLWAADPLSLETIGNPVVRAEAAAYSPDGRYFALGGATTVLYDAKTRKSMKLLSLKRDNATALAFSRDSKRLAVEYLFFSPPAKGEHLAHEIVIYGLPDGKRALAFGGPNGSTKKLFDLETGALLAESKKGSTRSVVVDPGFTTFLLRQRRLDARPEGRDRQHRPLRVPAKVPQP